MNFRVIAQGGKVLQRFPYEYQAIEFARECLARNQSVQVWYDSLVTGLPKQLLELI